MSKEEFKGIYERFQVIKSLEKKKGNKGIKIEHRSTYQIFGKHIGISVDGEPKLLLSNKCFLSFSKKRSKALDFINEDINLECILFILKPVPINKVDDYIINNLDICSLSKYGKEEEEVLILTNSYFEIENIQLNITEKGKKFHEITLNYMKKEIRDKLDKDSKCNEMFKEDSELSKEEQEIVEYKRNSMLEMHGVINSFMPHNENAKYLCRIYLKVKTGDRHQKEKKIPLYNGFFMEFKLKGVTKSIKALVTICSNIGKTRIDNKEELIVELGQENRFNITLNTGRRHIYFNPDKNQNYVIIELHSEDYAGLENEIKFLTPETTVENEIEECNHFFVNVPYYDTDKSFNLKEKEGIAEKIDKYRLLHYTRIVDKYTYGVPIFDSESNKVIGMQIGTSEEKNERRKDGFKLKLGVYIPYVLDEMNKKDDKCIIF